MRAKTAQLQALSISAKMGVKFFPYKVFHLPLPITRLEDMQVSQKKGNGELLNGEWGMGNKKGRMPISSPSLRFQGIKRKNI
jgi:hypothetical protein